MQPRAEYLADHSLSRDKPWLSEGISRRTWERRRKRGASLAGILTTAKVRPATELRVVEDGTSPTRLPASPDLCLRLYALGLLHDLPVLSQAA